MQNIRRLIKYCFGIISVSLGIVLCKQCGMGISPLSSIPYVLSLITPLSLGNFTTIFHFVNTLIQMVLRKNFKDVRLWLQFILAFAFGVVIDFINGLIHINNAMLLWQIIALVLSVFFTALGSACMLDANLIQNPPDGTVKQIALMTNQEIGKVKTYYDITCVLITIVLGVIFLHKIAGLGIATIVSALFVGRTITLLKKIKSTFNKK